jgi:hypothetical protein
LRRVVQSFVIDPGRPGRRGAELRRYLRRWVAPALDTTLSNCASPRAQ